MSDTAIEANVRPLSPPPIQEPRDVSMLEHPETSDPDVWTKDGCTDALPEEDAPSAEKA